MPFFCNDEELKLLQQTGTHIAHCPTSNMRLGSDICRVVEMLEMGINVGLAVDGASSLKATDVLTMATSNGAKVLKFIGIGELKPGFAADLAIFNVGKMEYAGVLSDPVAALVFSGFNHVTDYTIVAGKVVVGIDEQVLAARAHALSLELIVKHQ